MSLLELLVLLAASALVSMSLIWVDIDEIFAIGKSSKAQDKIKSQYTIHQRLSLKHVTEHSSFFQKKLHTMIAVRKLNYVLIGFLLCLIVLSIFNSNWTQILKYALILKVVIIDAPLLLNFAIVMKPDIKKGGIKARYEGWLDNNSVAYRNKNK